LVGDAQDVVGHGPDSLITGGGVVATTAAAAVPVHRTGGDEVDSACLPWKNQYPIIAWMFDDTDADLRHHTHAVAQPGGSISSVMGVQRLADPPVSRA
jgi:hypothetical protein